MSEIDQDFGYCMLGNVRRASRAVSRRYDAMARQLDMTGAQFSIIALIHATPGKTAGELSDMTFIERSALVRNLALLEKRNLVVGVSEKGSSRKEYRLTDVGVSLYERAVPVWKQAQRELAEVLGESDFLETVEKLKRLSKV
ncbi:MAG: winged helix-turn-helix transcriptional regulator [Rhodobacteraceae bacterium]|nr:winged helix-turn-helix transcriptional regulator [Paracoccaceae bacterium]